MSRTSSVNFRPSMRNTHDGAKNSHPQEERHVLVKKVPKVMHMIFLSRNNTRGFGQFTGEVHLKVMDLK